MMIIMATIMMIMMKNNNISSDYKSHGSGLAPSDSDREREDQLASRFLIFIISMITIDNYHHHHYQHRHHRRRHHQGGARAGRAACFKAGKTKPRVQRHLPGGLIVLIILIMEFMIFMTVIIFNIITIMTLATSTIELLQGTPSARDGQRRGLGNEDLIGSHEYGSHPQTASHHRGARTDSDLESPDAGDDATFTSIVINILEQTWIKSQICFNIRWSTIVDHK